ncbi:hypothetical protein GCM10008939_32580 [Deinococcus aquiradiocola]|uniref:Uncharacterized protein n=1 Tax=Deinococcus aquiradiocola TaxID=393059 RepID=A0A917PPN6_9DEIO|nr:hypothetical protein GCM10008939_32580 [Deinococcus aquiradiocola]
MFTASFIMGMPGLVMVLPGIVPAGRVGAAVAGAGAVWVGTVWVGAVWAGPGVRIIGACCPCVP